jgi:ribosomal protein S18 acetylase RimI-like enzyme
MDIRLRPATADDLEYVKWALYTAFAWKPERQRYSPELVLDRPDAARYYRDWGRPGDLGVVAHVDGDLAGLAFCRLFTAADHGHGYVDDQTPEIGVAVAEGWRGRGLGTRLLAEIATAARVAGFARLSLSVDAGNPAIRLYQRIGYQEVSRDPDGVRMIQPLSPPSSN